ncbi:hypothetical protein KP004_18710 [Geomonas oryzisoli]|uniref:Uncharacterized protein n=1 Tax=Geomonas oryzisoli TaxID=2847992 RepID=A0ABX8J905_9BACT|nr:hypothetical protein [Geomonas oryzisoli]QWV93174.1 hypothetical protein KP004_18710 [Geomonas oryzisoli]
MDHKTKGVVLGLAGVILWFMPLANFGFMGLDLYQTGSHIGGISYLLLTASAGYAVLSWFEQHQLRIIAAGIATAIGPLPGPVRGPGRVGAVPAHRRFRRQLHHGLLRRAAAQKGAARGGGERPPPTVTAKKEGTPLDGVPCRYFSFIPSTG